MKPQLVSLSLIVAAGLAGCDATKPVARQAPERPVLVADMHYAPRERAAALPGVVAARVESELSFRVAGRIARRLVDVGGVVRKGDALAKLDEADLKLQLEAAEADRAQARAALVDAEAEERRVATLTRQGWAAKAEFDKVESAANQARAAADKAERGVALAENSLGYATLTADADGVVSATLAEPGQVVAAGTPILRLAHTDVMEGAVAIPETWTARASTAKARVSFWALPGVETAAALRELSPSADPTTRTFAARFALADPPPGARLGMSVTLTLDDGAPKLARAPLGAVFDNGAGQQVWVVDPSTGAVARTPVEVASEDAEWAYISSGVREGAEIVALGVHKIDADEKVHIVKVLAGF